MYQKYFGLRQAVFSITPDPRYLYLSKQHREALAHLLYGVREGGGFVLLTGEVGTGKTTICRAFLEQLPEQVDVALVLNPALTASELLQTVCEEFGIAVSQNESSLKVLLNRLNDYLLDAHAKGKRPVLMIDEAQNLAPGVLEQIRMLTNLETHTHKLLQVFLIGQPELRESLERRELRQLAQRITARFHLHPLSSEEAKDYIDHRLAVGGAERPLFTRKAVRRVFRLTGGVPRLINILCDRALLGAFASSCPIVDQKIVAKASRELKGEQPSPGLLLPILTGVVFSFIAAFAGWLAYRSIEHEKPPPLLTFPDSPQSESITGKNGKNPVANGSLKRGAVEPLPGAAAVEPGFRAQVLNPPGHQTIPSGQKDAIEPMPDAAAVEPGFRPEVPSLPGRQTPPSGQEDAPEPESTHTDAQASGGSTSRRGEMPLEQSAFHSSEHADTGGMISSRPGSEELKQTLDTAVVIRTTALTRLLNLWTIEYPVKENGDPCLFAGTEGLRCHRLAGDWNLIRQFDRPAVIRIDGRSGPSGFVVIHGLTPEHALLDLGEGKSISIPLSRLAGYWAGEFEILWRPPPGGYSLISPRSTGGSLSWLRKTLSRIPGYDPGDRDSDKFDKELLGEILRFQKQHGLTPDGLVGPKTMIALNTAAALPGIPRLEKVN